MRAFLPLARTESKTQVDRTTRWPHAAGRVDRRAALPFTEDKALLLLIVSIIFAPKLITVHHWILFPPALHRMASRIFTPFRSEFIALFRLKKPTRKNLSSVERKNLYKMSH